MLPGKPGITTPMVRLREAELSDAQALAALYDAVGRTEAPTSGTMRDWLATNGALLVEGTDGTALAAVRYRRSGDGWEVDRVATLPTERGQGYGRWLMTKLEALAIRGNVKHLTIEVEGPDLLPYYRRMGYRADGDEPTRLSKRVGGVWQRQELER